MVAMLAIGLWPGDYRFRNDAKWRDDGGLQFGPFGFAYTEPFITPAQSAEINKAGFTLMLGLTPAPPQTPGFQFVASLTDGDDTQQLMIGQWQDELIVMNGDDYSHARGLPRVYANLSPFMQRQFLLTVVTGSFGTILKADSEVIGQNAKIHLLIPGLDRKIRLTLGNSVHANAGWSGAMHSFALFSGQKPAELLRFDRSLVDRLKDVSGSGADAILPSPPLSVVRSFLSDDPRELGLNYSRVKDVAVNLLGFIPFGMVLASLLKERRWQRSRTIATVALYGFILSFLIEAVQAWIPTRSSSAVDLMLNTVSAITGAYIFRAVTTPL